MKIRPSLGIAYLLLSLSVSANAAVVDFEAVPGDSPADKLAISDQYLATEGVSFSLSNGDTPFLEQTGGNDSGNGFSNDQRGFAPDIEAVGLDGQLGAFFLRIGTVTFSSVPVPELIINYVTPVSAASGEIWDIDGRADLGTEQWQVTGYDSAGSELATAISPVGSTFGASSLDGKPWTWGLETGTSSIASIRIAFIGTKTTNIGLAFDNFSPSLSVIPVPAGIFLFSSAIGILGWIQRRAC